MRKKKLMRKKLTRKPFFKVNLQEPGAHEPWLRAPFVFSKNSVFFSKKSVFFSKNSVISAKIPFPQHLSLLEFAEIVSSRPVPAAGNASGEVLRCGQDLGDAQIQRERPRHRLTQYWKNAAFCHQNKMLFVIFLNFRCCISHWVVTEQLQVLLFIGEKIRILSGKDPRASA